jgi:hypothetical protein
LIHVDIPEPGLEEVRQQTGVDLSGLPPVMSTGRSEKPTVWFEHLGEYHDDVLVSLAHDEPAVAATRALLSWTGWWDADFQVWRVNPGYAERLAADLRDLGYTVRCPRKAAKGDEALVTAD